MDLGDLFSALFQPTGSRRPVSRLERWINRAGAISFVLFCAFIYLVYSGF